MQRFSSNKCSLAMGTVFEQNRAYSGVQCCCAFSAVREFYAVNPNEPSPATAASVTAAPTTSAAPLPAPAAAAPRLQKIHGIGALLSTALQERSKPAVQGLHAYALALPRPEISPQSQTLIHRKRVWVHGANRAFYRKLRIASLSARKALLKTASVMLQKVPFRSS